MYNCTTVCLLKFLFPTTPKLFIILLLLLVPAALHFIPPQVPEQDWIGDYKSQISSPQSCINEWEALPDLLSRRPLSPDHFSQISPDAQDAETKKTVIKAKLRSLPVSVDQ